MNKLVKILIYVFFALFVLYFLITLIAPKIVDKQHNQIRNNPPYEVSSKATAIFTKLDFVADMHCDALLWKRDLLKDNDFGQVDIPKMLKSNVGIQAFTIVTKSPKGQNFDKNTGDSDNISMLYLVQGRPTFSLTKRALKQCEALNDFAKKSDGKFRVITSKSQMKNYINDKKNEKEITAGFLGVEGAHALDGKLENVQVLFNHGVRMMAATHFFDNEMGGSVHGVSQTGLTMFGKEVIQKMVELEMIIDIAHCSEKLIDDIFAMTNQPVISSHTGVKGTCNKVRNLSDKHVKAIANSNGLICIAMFEEAVCGVDAAATATAIKYAVDLVGADFVALGSDFDGSVTTPFNITGLPLIVDELLKLDIREEEIRKIMGENVKRFLVENLPSSGK